MSEFKDEEIDIDDLLGEEFEQPKVAGQNIEHAPNPTEVGEANNVFAGIEKHLKLPLGSTKEGIKAAKEESKKIIDNAKTVTAQANIIKSKESINDNLPVPRYDAETLANDRAAVRERAWRVYEIGERWLNVLDEQIMSTIAPTDQNWGAAAKMYDSVNKALQGIMKLLTSLRQEDELASLKLAAEAPADADGNGETDPSKLGKGREMTTQEVNALIDAWGAERDAAIKEEIAASRTKRLADKSEENIAKG